MTAIERVFIGMIKGHLSRGTGSDEIYGWLRPVLPDGDEYSAALKTIIRECEIQS